MGEEVDHEEAEVAEYFSALGWRFHRAGDVVRSRFPSAEYQLVYPEEDEYQALAFESLGEVWSWWESVAKKHFRQIAVIEKVASIALSESPEGDDVRRWMANEGNHSWSSSFSKLMKSVEGSRFSLPSDWKKKMISHEKESIRYSRGGFMDNLDIYIIKLQRGALSSNVARSSNERFRMAAKVSARL